METNSPMNLLLLSRKSFEKSVTGNRILQQKKFTTYETTLLPQVESCTIGGRLVKVVDTPGLCEDKSAQDSIGQFLENWKEGFNAIVIVLRYPTNMTYKEIETISTIKTLIGENDLGQYGILLFTNGVLIKNNPSETFDGYLEKEISEYKNKGYQNLPRESLGKLILDVNRRCVIFDNDDPSNLGDVEVLISKIDHMMYVNRYRRYSKRHWLAYRKPAIIFLSFVLGMIASIVIIVTFL